MYVDELQNMNLNLGLLYKGDLKLKNKDSREERSYYYNNIEYWSAPAEKSTELESYDKGLTYYVRGKPASYNQCYEVKSWADVIANEPLREALFFISGLDYIT